MATLKVWTDLYLVRQIFAFVPGRKEEEWVDGDLAIQLSHLPLLKRRKMHMGFSSESIHTLCSRPYVKRWQSTFRWCIIRFWEHLAWHDMHLQLLIRERFLDLRWLMARSRIKGEAMRWEWEKLFQAGSSPRQWMWVLHHWIDPPHQYVVPHKRFQDADACLRSMASQLNLAQLTFLISYLQINRRIVLLMLASIDAHTLLRQLWASWPATVQCEVRSFVEGLTTQPARKLRHYLPL